MKQGLYKILYCSRNLIQGECTEQEAEIQQILNASRMNNSRQDVTGALLYNSGCFAQVLEGPQSAIETIFERIQRDARHGDVTILTSGAGGERDFPNWAMAHVQPPSEKQAAGIAATLDVALIKPEDAGAEVLDLLKSLVVQED